MAKRRPPNRARQRIEPAAPAPAGGLVEVAAPGAPAAPGRPDRVIAGALFLVLSALYAATMPPTVTLEDTGELLTVAHRLGIAHPPGYPLYTLLAHVFSWLPFGAARSVYALNAALAAGTAVVVYAIARSLALRRETAALCAFGVGITRTFWSQAIIAEVYTLNAFLFAGMVLVALSFGRTGRPRPLVAFGLLLGLSFANHWPLTVLAVWPFGLLLLRDLRRHRTGARTLALVAAAFVAGLSPYAYLYVVSKGPLDVAFLGPVDTLGKLWRYALREHYDRLYEGNFYRVEYSFHLMLRVLRAGAAEHGYVGLLLVVPGLALAARQPRRFALLWLSLLTTPLVLPFAFRDFYDPLASYNHVVFNVIPYALLALFAGVAIEALAARFPARRWPFVAAGAILVAGAAVNFLANQSTRDTLALDYARAVLETLPKDAHLLVSDDMDSGPILYARHVEHIRPDVTLQSQSGLFVSPPLVDPLEPDGRKLQQAFSAHIKRHGRLFVTLALRGFDPVKAGVTSRYNGLYYEYATSDATPSHDGPGLLQRARELLDRAHAGRYNPAWLKHRNAIVSRMCNVLVLAGRDHPLLHADPGCMVTLGRHLLAQGQWAQAAPLFEAVMRSPTPMFTVDRFNAFESYFRARLALANAAPAADRPRLFQELADATLPAAWLLPQCENNVVGWLAELGKQARVSLPLARLEAEFRHCPKLTTALRALR